MIKFIVNKILALFFWCFFFKSIFHLTTFKLLFGITLYLKQGRHELKKKKKAISLITCIKSPCWLFYISSFVQIRTRVKHKYLFILKIHRLQSFHHNSFFLTFLCRLYRIKLSHVCIPLLKKKENRKNKELEIESL